jgi:hypothetical protein
MELEATLSRKQGIAHREIETRWLALPTVQVNITEAIVACINYASKKRKHNGEICKLTRNYILLSNSN